MWGQPPVVMSLMIAQTSRDYIRNSKNPITSNSIAGYASNSKSHRAATRGTPLPD